MNKCEHAYDLTLGPWSVEGATLPNNIGKNHLVGLIVGCRNIITNISVCIAIARHRLTHDAHQNRADTDRMKDIELILVIQVDRNDTEKVSMAPAQG